MEDPRVQRQTNPTKRVNGCVLFLVRSLHQVAVGEVACLDDAAESVHEDVAVVSVAETPLQFF